MPTSGLLDRIVRDQMVLWAMFQGEELEVEVEHSIAASYILHDISTQYQVQRVAVTQWRQSRWDQSRSRSRNRSPHCTVESALFFKTTVPKKRSSKFYCYNSFIALISSWAWGLRCVISLFLIPYSFFYFHIPLWNEIQNFFFGLTSEEI